MGEFLSELGAHWNDGYWWADHQLLLSALTAGLWLAVWALQMMLERRWRPPADGGKDG